jgi:hypothetical protein
MRWFHSIRRPYILGFFLVVAVGAHAAPPACAPEIVGSWTGQVLDEGRMKELHTDFSTRTGALTGTYHVEDTAGGYDGTLTDFMSSGPCSGRFLWHDHNGTGVVRVEFRPERDRFDGEWGDASPFPGHIFTGMRFRRVPVS